ncbi:hypothetical protein [Streptomyces sp. NPDC006477]|uniref:hypothetical protein n=1 Tax=Streptomyces sp. NPDC006477 TaxID=3364747 RepID=UPI0036AFD861
MPRDSISARNFRKIPVVGLVPESSSTAPADPTAGQLWYDTSSGKMKWTQDGSTFLDPLARANHTGTQLANTISDFTAAVQAISISSLSAAIAPVNFGNQRGENVASPINPTDIANKQYVDNSRAGISVKDPVRIALTANVDLTNPGSTLDGVAMGVDYRFLAAGQTDGTQNGVYLWKGASVSAVRSSDTDTTGEVVDGTLVAVADGTHAGKQFMQSAEPSGAPGAWTQVWTVFTMGGQTYTGDGNGVEVSGTTISLELDGTTLSKSASGLKLNMATVATGGTGSSTAAGARTNLGAAGVYSTNLGAVTAGVSVVITHNLNRQFPTVQVWDVDANAQVDADIRSTGVNTVTLISALAWASGKLHVVVTG